MGITVVGTWFRDSLSDWEEPMTWQATNFLVVVCHLVFGFSNGSDRDGCCKTSSGRWASNRGKFNIGRPRVNLSVMSVLIQIGMEALENKLELNPNAISEPYDRMWLERLVAAKIREVFRSMTHQRIHYSKFSAEENNK